MKTLILALLSCSLFAQTVDNSTFTHVTPYPVRYTFPGSCGLGEMMTYASGTAGANIYVCDGSNTWHAISGAVAGILACSAFPALSGDITTSEGACSTTIGAAKVAPAMLKAGTVSVQTDGSTVTWAIGSVLNAQAALTFTVHSGSRTLNITNPVIGGNYLLKLVQDGTGGEGLILGTGCTWKVSGGGGGAVTLTNSAAAVDMLSFTFDGTTCYATVLSNFN